MNDKVIKMSDHFVYIKQADKIRNQILAYPSEIMKDRWKFLARNSDDLVFLKKLLKKVNSEDIQL